MRCFWSTNQPLPVRPSGNLPVDIVDDDGGVVGQALVEESEIAVDPPVGVDREHPDIPKVSVLQQIGSLADHHGHAVVDPEPAEPVMQPAEIATAIEITVVEVHGPKAEGLAGSFRAERHRKRAGAFIGPDLDKRAAARVFREIVKLPIHANRQHAVGVLLDLLN